MMSGSERRMVELHEREAAEKQHGDNKHKKEQYLGRLSV